MRKRAAHRAAICLTLSAILVPSIAPAATRPADRSDDLACTDPSNFSAVSRPGPYGVLPGELTVLRSAYDGDTIQVGVVRPDLPAGMRAPVIAFASPYFFGGLDGDLRLCSPRLVDNFVQHGYAIAFIPVRGTADSGSCMDLMGKAERADLDQAVTWLGEQPWSNGAVGMIGVSYDGSTPWEVASMGNPHLKTIVPISGVNDAYDLMYGDGVNESRGALLLNASYYQFGFVNYNATSGRSPEHMASGVACPESLKGFAAAAYSFATGERDPLGFWAERNLRPGVEAGYDGSIMLVHGLQDGNVDAGHAYPWVKALEGKGLYVKHLLGQWGHAWPDSPTSATTPFSTTRWDWADMLLDWFDYWLKGDTTVDLGARAQIQDSSGMWRNDVTWPAADATPLVLHLTAGGALSKTTSSSGTALVAPGHENVSCESCATFISEPMEATTRISGLPEVRLRVVPTGPVGHITATLSSGGRSYLYASERPLVLRERIGSGQADLRFPQGGEKAQPVIPGQPIDVRILLEPVDAVVPEGARLTLQLHLGSYADHTPSAPTAPSVIELGDGMSTITLHTFERDASAFFPPPPPPNPHEE